MMKSAQNPLPQTAQEPLTASAEENAITTSLIDHQLPPPYAASKASNMPSKRLPLPIAIPRNGPGPTDPFFAGLPASANTGISDEEWSDFIDGLDEACKRSPAVKVVGMVQSGLAMVPNLLSTRNIPAPYVRWATTGIGHAATMGSHVGSHLYSKRICDKYLQAANDRLFSPRGLTCRLFTTQALRLFLGMDVEEPNTLSNIMNTVGPAAMSLGMPKVDRAVHMIAEKANGKPKDTIERYRGGLAEPGVHALEMLRGRVLPLQYQVAPLASIAPHSWSSRASSLISHKSTPPAPVTSQPGHPVPSKADQKSEEKVLHEQKRRQAGKTPKRLGYKEENLALRRYWDMERLVWVVVMNKEDDTKISGAKQYDCSETVPISEQEVQAELAREEVYRAGLADLGTSDTDTYGSGSEAESSGVGGRMGGRSSVGSGRAGADPEALVSAGTVRDVEAGGAGKRRWNDLGGKKA